MTIYCDASVIVTALTGEEATAKAQTWLAGHAPAELAASPWVGTEVASALARKQRKRALTDEQRRNALAQWQALLLDWQVIPIADAHFTGAGTLTTRGLRAGDALHLAIVLAKGAELATGDRRLADVARELGVTVHWIGTEA